MDLTSQRWLNGRWIIGGAIMAIGVLLLLMNTGMIDRFPVWKLFPAILVVIGINKLMTPYHRADGFWLISVGVWLEVSLLRVFGVGFQSTWPVVFILLGVFWMWESIEKEARHRNAQQQENMNSPVL